MHATHGWLQITQQSLPLTFLLDTLEELLQPEDPNGLSDNAEWWTAEYNRIATQYASSFHRFPDRVTDLSSAPSRLLLLALLTASMEGPRIRIFGPAGAGKTYVLGMLCTMYCAIIHRVLEAAPSRPHGKVIYLAPSNGPLRALS